MTEEQWIAIQGDISSIRVLLFALAGVVPDQAALRAAFLRHKEIQETVFLNSKLPDKQIQAVNDKLRDIEKGIWG